MKKHLAKIAALSIVFGSMFMAISAEAAGPATKDSCKNGGWMNFTSPTFKNQGQCVSAFEHFLKAQKQNPLLCFDGTTDGGFGGLCSITNGVATLDNSDSNPTGDYSGVYYSMSNYSGQLLSSLTSLGYTYSGNISPGPGDLSLNVPVDTNGDSSTDAYAYVDAFYCPGTGGVVNITSDPACGIWFMGLEYPNWSALVTVFPTATVTSGSVPFVVAERTPAEPSAIWMVSNVNLGQ